MFHSSTVYERIFFFTQVNGRRISIRLSNVLHIEESSDKKNTLIHAKDRSEPFVAVDSFDVIARLFFPPGE